MIHQLAFHLNAITLTAALAKKDGREFFLLDGDWDRGHWADYFRDMYADWTLLSTLLPKFLH